MTKVDSLIRQLPIALLIAAVADFIRQAALIASYWNDVRYFSSVGPENDVYWKVVFDLMERGFGLVIYPLAWIASAATIHLLLGIRDRGTVDNA